MEADNESQSTTYALYEERMQSIWRVVYWTSFALSWLIIIIYNLSKRIRLILPILQEYVDAGEFKAKDKLIRSLKTNLLFYIVFAVLGIIVGVYLKLSGSWNGYFKIFKFS